MEHFPSTLTRPQCEEAALRMEEHFERHGYGIWVLEASNRFAGIVGLEKVPFKAFFAPAVEIGWLLAREAWGRGFASEAARACLNYAFDTLNLNEVVSIATVTNPKSQLVMQRIGMVADREFDHPELPPGHPLRRHMLYRAKKARTMAA